MLGRYLDLTLFRHGRIVEQTPEPTTPYRPIVLINNGLRISSLGDGNIYNQRNTDLIFV